MTPPSRERLLALLVELSYERRPVVLASGARSDFYVDCKQTALHPEGAAALGHQLRLVVESLETQAGERACAIGGMTLGADPLATALSLDAWHNGRHLPAFIVRKTPKGHGTAAYIEGMRNLEDGGAVILLEDVVTSGGTTIEAAKRLRAAGLRPLGVACVVDREAGGLDALRAAGLPTQALFRRADFPVGSEA